MNIVRLLSASVALSFAALVSAQTPEAPKAPQAPQKAEKPAEKPAEKKGDDCSNCADKQMQPASPASKADMAKGMKLKDATLISDILAAPEKFEGKRVLVKGPAVAVCETRGCWVNLKSDKDAAKALRVKVEDGEIVFPMTCLGKEVQVEGVMEKMVIPVETLRDALKKQAEKKGEKFDPASVKEPRIVWQLKGLGAKFETK